MNTITQYDQKFASLSKTMRIFFQICFLFVIALVIVPWLLPTNKFCGFLLTLFPQIPTLTHAYQTTFSSISI